MLRGMRTFLAAAVFAAVAEGAVIYGQMPSSERKYCASMELGDLLRNAAQAEAELKAARAQVQKATDDVIVKEVMRLEATAAAAWNEVAKLKQQQRQGSEAPCR